MAHLRKQIRDNIKTTLTGLNSTSSNVFLGRVHPVGEDKLPCLFIYTDEEESGPTTMGARRYERTVTVSIDAIVQANSGYDDELDQIALEVEEALQADVERNNLATDTRVVAWKTDYSDEGKISLARGAISVEVDYEHIEGDSETAA
jgi:hypothetical protein